jgi:signal peptide peptidase SppA
MSKIRKRIKMMKKFNNNVIAEVVDVNGPKRSLTKLEQLMSYIPFLKKSSPVVAVLRLSGPIGKVNMKSGLCIEALNDLIEKAFNISKLEAVCLCINSPGGSPVQSELIAGRIISLSNQKKVPVYSFVEDVAASGGYWLACAGKEIYASKSSILGSIGVISSSFGFKEAIQRLGIERRVYYEGKNKSVLDPFQDAKEDDIEIIKKLQRQIHTHFIDYVKTRRIGKLTQDDEILFNGEFWAGETALDFGLIDGIDDMYSFINTKFGQDIKIEYITAKQSWFMKKIGVATALFSDNLVASTFSTIEARYLEDRFNLK